MELDFFQKKEQDIDSAVDWTRFQKELNQLGEEYVAKSSSFFGACKSGDTDSNKFVVDSLNDLIESSNFDEDIKGIIRCLTLHGGVFDSSENREELISKISISIFESFKDKIIQTDNATDRALIISKILLFSSPTEILVSIMAECSVANRDFAKSICSDLVRFSREKYPVCYKQELDEKEIFQVSAPFLRTIIFSEQMQVALIVANSIREFLNDIDPQAWFDIAPLFKLCLERQSKIMDVGTLSVEDGNKVIDTSIQDLLANHEEIALDPTIEISNMPNIIFRKYQDRTVERISTEFLALIREFTSVLPKINHAGMLSSMIRYIQDYLIAEIASINSNCFIYSELSDRSFVELLVVTIDKVRERISAVSENSVELKCFDQLIQYELLPEVLKDGYLIQFIDEHIEEMAISKVNLFREILEASAMDVDSEKIFLAQLGAASPYRFISTLNWINWRDVESEINFNEKKDSLLADPLFTPALMLSWVIYKELSYNKELVGVSS